MLGAQHLGQPKNMVHQAQETQTPNQRGCLQPAHLPGE